MFGNSSQKHPDWFDQILSKCCVEPWWSRELTITDKEIIHTQKHCQEGCRSINNYTRDCRATTAGHLGLGTNCCSSTPRSLKVAECLFLFCTQAPTSLLPAPSHPARPLIYSERPAGRALKTTPTTPFSTELEAGGRLLSHPGASEGSDHPWKMYLARRTFSSLHIASKEGRPSLSGAPCPRGIWVFTSLV